ncbi:MAG: ABC transporter ATP-binding protein [Dehalococcoidia bacterium]|nr:ABC transporter ATP-binding protein [Dehalococcoidia bacterium]MYA52990.1 ABC transporter ATP-binding protein [Dehalococcoidia bacterium]
MRLSAEHLSLRYNGRDAVHDVSLDLESGELIAIVGPNGSGKTTLLRGLSRLLKPTTGHVLLDGEEIRSMAPRAVAQRLAVLPQEHPEGVDVTVRELVWRGRAPHQGILQRATPADHEAVAWAMEAADVHDVAGRSLGSLSGGERQRAWVALALAQQPRVLLLDEPTSFLDVQHQVEIMALLSRLNDQGMTIVAVLHDLALAGRFMQRVIGMRDGSVAFDGPPAEVLRPEPLEEVFGVPMIVLEDPESGLPVPLPGYPDAAGGASTS